MSYSHFFSASRSARGAMVPVLCFVAVFLVGIGLRIETVHAAYFQGIDHSQATTSVGISGNFDDVRVASYAGLWRGPSGIQTVYYGIDSAIWVQFACLGGLSLELDASPNPDMSGAIQVAVSSLNNAANPDVINDYIYYGQASVELRNDRYYTVGLVCRSLNRGYVNVYFSDNHPLSLGLFDFGYHASGNALGGMADSLDTLLNNLFHGNAATRKEPALIVPGILGSWPDHGHLVLDPILHTYDPLIQALTLQGYEPDKTLFTFPYDWANDATSTAFLLGLRLQSIRNICACSRVNVIAHSFGGIVARAYAEGDKYQNDIDQLILVGTPNRGAPEAYLIWEGGSVAPPPLDASGVLLSTYFNLEAIAEGFSNTADLIHRHPFSSVEDLLPVSDYFKDVSSGVLRTYPAGYPANSFLDALNASSSVSQLALRGITVTNISGNIEPNTFRSAEVDHTIGAIRVVQRSDIEAAQGLWEHGSPEGFGDLFGDHGLEKTEGDGTVPLASAIAIPAGNQITITSDDSNLHRLLPTLAIKDILVALLNAVPDNLALDAVAQSSGNDSSTVIIGASPGVDLTITDASGHRTGKDFSTGSEVAEIPGSFSSGDDPVPPFNIHYVAVPHAATGTYTIATKGKTTGTYRIEAVSLGSSTTRAVSFSGTTTQGTEQNLNLIIPSSGQANDTSTATSTDPSGLMLVPEHPPQPPVSPPAQSLSCKIKT